MKSTLLALILLQLPLVGFARPIKCVSTLMGTMTSAKYGKLAPWHLESIVKEWEQKVRTNRIGIEKSNFDQLQQALVTNRYSNLPMALKVLAVRKNTQENSESTQLFLKESARFLSRFGEDSSNYRNIEPMGPASSTAKKIVEAMALTESPEAQAVLMKLFKSTVKHLDEIEREKGEANNTYTKNNQNLSIRRALKSSALSEDAIATAAKDDLLADFANLAREKGMTRSGLSVDRLERALERNDVALLVKAFILKARNASTDLESSVAIKSLVLISELGTDTSNYRYSSVPEKASTTLINFLSGIHIGLIHTNLNWYVSVMTRAMQLRIKAENQGKVLSVNKALEEALSAERN
jgi:hypothetical protein